MYLHFIKISDIINREMDSLLKRQHLETIPYFPEKRSIALEDKGIFNVLFKIHQPEISEFTFSNLFCWQDAYKIRISRLDDFIIISSGAAEELFFFPPLGDGDSKRAIKICLEEFPQARFFRVSSFLASLWEEEDFKVIEDRNNFDYVYRRLDLAGLKGRRYDGKRNFIRRLYDNYAPVCRQMSAADIENCLKFQDRWCDYRSCGNDAGLMREKIAIKRMLSNFKALGLLGVVIEIDSRLEAFSLGEGLNAETFVVHAEKGNGKFVGIYPAINNFFASTIPERFSFINREQDLGIENLRKAKTSYPPFKFIEKFIISKRR